MSQVTEATLSFARHLGALHVETAGASYVYLEVALRELFRDGAQHYASANGQAT